MPDAYTNQAAVSLDQTAYQLSVDYALRAGLHYNQVADVRATNQSMEGAAVKFTLMDDLATASTALDESTDVDAVALSDSQVTLTLAEHGNAALTTAKLAGTSFVPIDPIVANIISRNAMISLDELAAIELRAGDNVVYATGGSTTPTARNTVEPEDTITATDCRKVVAQLRAANVPAFEDDTYVGFIHPDVVFDLQSDTGGDGWLNPANYSEPERRWNGEMGRFAGVRWIESSRAPLFADAGSSTTLTDVYGTLVLGRQALAKAHSRGPGWGDMPTFVIGPVTDKLRRFQPVGWKWLGDFGRYREACLRRIDSASSIGSN